MIWIKSIVIFVLLSTQMSIAMVGQIDLDSIRFSIIEKSNEYENSPFQQKKALSKELAFEYFYTDLDNTGFIEWAEKYMKLCAEKNDRECSVFGYLHFLPNYSFYNDSLFQLRLQEAKKLSLNNKNSILDLGIAISEAQYSSFVDGDFKDGLQRLGEAEFINDQIGENEITAYLYYLISSVYKYSGQPEKAVDYAHKIFSLDQLNAVDQARAHMAKGIALLDANQLDSVAYHLENAAVYYTELSNTYSLIVIYNTLGKYYINRGEPQHAITYFSKIKPIVEQVEYSFGSPLYESYYHMGVSYTALNQVDSARHYYQKCIDQAIIEKDLDALILYRSNRAYEALSILDQKENDHASALKNYKTFKAYSDTLSKYTRNQAIEELSIKYETREKEQQIDLLNKDKEKFIERAILIAVAIGTIALISFISYLNSNRKNKIITEKNEQLEEMNSVKDRFFAIIGHDLREPAIVFNDLSLKVKYLLDKKDFNSLEKLSTQIEASGFSLQKIIDNLLNWALSQRNVVPYSPENTLIIPLINEVKSALNHRAKEKNIEIILKEKEALYVYADKNSLFTILLNLIDNAIKYSNPNSSILLNSIQSDNQIKIQIIDSGKGMTQGQMDRIFQLSQNKSQRGTAGEKGLGLGLHIAHELAKINGGRIEVSSEIGAGSTFEVVMPVGEVGWSKWLK